MEIKAKASHLRAQSLGIAATLSQQNFKLFINYEAYQIMSDEFG